MVSIYLTFALLLHAISRHPVELAYWNNVIGIDALYAIEDCVQIIIESMSVNYTRPPSPLVNEIFASSRPYVVRSRHDIIAQDIRVIDESVLTPRFHGLSSCRLYLIATVEWRAIFIAPESTIRFRPHSKIIVIARKLPEWTPELYVFVKRRALHVVWLFSGSVYRLSNNATIRSPMHQLHKTLKHDLVIERSPSGHKDLFVVSLSMCEPYVMRYKDVHNHTRFDGVEYRLIQQMARFFKLVYSVEPSRPNEVWSKFAITEVELRRADVALCCPWLFLERYIMFDLTQFVSRKCGTFLVPKKQTIDPARYVYLAMSQIVWVFTMVSFVLTAVLIILLARQRRKFGLAGIYVSGFRTVLDLIAILTSHGLDSLTGEASRTIRMLLIVWLFSTSLLGVGYTTFYTALLSSPIYTPTVNTIAEYVEQDFVWSIDGDVGSYQRLAKGLPQYQQDKLFEKSYAERTKAEQTKRILAGDRRVTYYVDILFDRYITSTRDLLSRKVRSMRPMDTCWFTHYTTLALQKYSPYLHLLDGIVQKFREGGFFVQWFDTLHFENRHEMLVMLQKSTEHKLNKRRSLAIDDLIGVFSMLIIGWILGGLTFALELVRSKYSRLT